MKKRAPKYENDPIYMTEEEILKVNDVFSLGCIIGELFTSSPLFTSANLSSYQEGNFKPNLSSVLLLFLFILLLLLLFSYLNLSVIYFIF